MAKRTKAGGGEIVTAVQLAGHLDCARSYLDKLEAGGVITRLPGGGFNLAASRVGYIRYLRRERATSSKGAAEREFTTAKTALVGLRMQEKLGQLVPRAVLEDSLDIVVGLYRTELAALPASFTRDILERRRLDRLIHELLKRVAAEAARRAGNVAASESDGRSEAFGLEASDASA